MSSISIRPLQAEYLLDVLCNLGMYTFRPSPPFQDKEEWAKVVLERKGVTLKGDTTCWKKRICWVLL